MKPILLVWEIYLNSKVEAAEIEKCMEIDIKLLNVGMF